VRSTLYTALFVLTALVGGALGGIGGVGTALADDEFQPGQSAIVTGTDGRGLRVRGGPGMSHRIVTTVNEGTVVQIAAGPVSDGDDDWYQISVGTATTGWSLGRYLTPSATLQIMTTLMGQRTFLAKTTAYTDGIGGIPLGGRTYSGTRTRWGVVAVDPKVIPIGSSLLIDGYGDAVFVAEDVGRAIKGTALDIWHPDQKAARAYGAQCKRVTILREGPAR
jgi:3D (Asp-Asp-Asp) domain-containing protein